MEFLHEEQVRSVLTYEALIPAVERALTDLSLRKIQQPVRSVLRLPDHEGIFGFMPAVDGELMGVKLVTIYENNVGIPTHQAVIQLFSARSGEPLVAMDGRLITEMRTAAVSAVAVRLFSLPDASVLAILGSGVQARSHLAALRHVRSFAEVRVWSRTEAHARRFATEFSVFQRPSAEAAVRGADVVVSVSGGGEPLIHGEWLGPSTLVCAVGAVGPDRRELDDVAMQAPVIVESREAAMRESGDLIASRQPVYAEIGDIVAGRESRPSAGRIVFKSLGVAATDIAAADLVWRNWCKRGFQ